MKYYYVFFEEYLRDDYSKEEKRKFLKCCMVDDDNECKELIMRYVGFLTKINYAITYERLHLFIDSNYKEYDWYTATREIAEEAIEYNDKYLIRCYKITNELVRDFNKYLNEIREGRFDKGWKTWITKSC